MKILAIETSCDETAAAVISQNEIRNGKCGELDSSSHISHLSILSNIVSSQIDIHKKFGGVFPEYASRTHCERIISVVNEAILKAEGMPLSEMPVGVPPKAGRNRLARAAESERATQSLSKNINLLAVTTGPGLIGSLLVGVNTTKALAYTNNLPIIGINHLSGHLYSNWANKPLPEFPAIILIVSGGHTGLYLMKSHQDIETLGETLDDAAGEAFDKVAKMLQLSYPGGPAIAKAAAKCHSERREESPANAGSRTSREILHGVYPEIYRRVQDDNISFPRSMLDQKDYNFSFSGLKTAVLYKVKELTQNSKLSPQLTAAIAAEFQQTVIDILVGKTIQAAYQYRPKSVCLCGGVSANKELRGQLSSVVGKLSWHPSFHIPHLELTTDNAAMIGIAAAYQIANGKQTTDYRHITANANLKL